MTQWRELHFQPPIDEQQLLGFLRALAADPARGGLVWEARTEAGKTRHLIGGDPTDLSAAMSTLRRLIPGLTVAAPVEPRAVVERAGRIRITGRHLALSTDTHGQTLRAVLAALSGATGKDDVLVLQVVLGRALAPEMLPTTAPDPSTSLAGLLLRGAAPASTAVRSRMQDKLAQYRFRAVVRIGVTSPSPVRRRLLVHSLLAAIRTLQSSGVNISLTTKNPANLDAGLVPLRQPLALTSEELLPLLAWPIQDGDLPGLPSRHPKIVPPPTGFTGAKERVFATATAPGSTAAIGIRIEDALRHTHVYGPTGAGKSTLLLHLIKADIDAGRSVVVIDPKRDLAMDTLSLIPEHRTGEVAIVDPFMDRPAGINPFAGLTGLDGDERRPLVAEIMLDLFRGLFPNAFGPLTADTLHASFLTLTYAPDASLAALPKLLTDDRYRRSVLARVEDPSLLDFWAQYEQKSPGQQANAVGPVMTRLRQFLLRPGVRAVLEQTNPTFRLEDLFDKRRILIVSLNKGLLGIQTASLLGSLVVAQLWQLIQARSAAPKEQRAPVSIYIDEAQNFLHLGDLAEALEQSRSLGAAWHLAHQHRGQMPAKLLDAIDANARNKILFGQEDAEAKTAARLTGLDAEDFSRLPPYEIYTSLQHHGTRTGWFSGRVLPPPKAVSSADAVIAEASARYGAKPDAAPRPAERVTAEADAHGEGQGDEVDDEPIGRTKRSPK
ncbi:type IV secretory system conjugative DNA transfer family protein [Microbacterium sp. B24]|uniref:type IV secretory system conjugative DNA transfer family protein n=1 Tax=Microbacterium sp. B24 TaxID=95616 RepID=UPI000409729B|nr:type IV secretory system conjugative DNA transfer family protein [Microbacterium sp. B24]